MSSPTPPPDGGTAPEGWSPAIAGNRRERAPGKVTTRQVAPGRYEATLLASPADAIAVAVTDAEPSTGITERLFIPDPAMEYRFRAPDEALLLAIAAATGGAWRPNAQSLSNAKGDRRTAHRALWPALVSLALLLWFADLVLRRIRLFESTSSVSTVG